MPIRKRNLSRRQALDSNAQAWLAGKPCGFFMFKSQGELQQLFDEYGDHENMFWRSRYCLPITLEKLEEYEDLWLNANSSFITSQYSDDEKQALWDERGDKKRFRWKQGMCRPVSL
jgi:hypothetical protein